MCLGGATGSAAGRERASATTDALLWGARILWPAWRTGLVVARAAAAIVRPPAGAAASTGGTAGDV